MLGGQMRDKARVVKRKVSPGIRVEGGYVKGDYTGPWFRCLYDPADESETRTAGGVRRRKGASLLASSRATDGTPIDLKATDSLEVNSKLHGLLLMDVDGAPERVRKVGLLARLKKVERKAPG